MELISSIIASSPLPERRMIEVRREAIFDCCKWDPQVGDLSVIANFALLISDECWRQLSCEAQRLYAEVLAAEDEIARSTKLIKMLSLPSRLESALIANIDQADSSERNVLRIMRFDFHPTYEGWKISEVNSDVPGGYIESAGISALMAKQYQGCLLTADPVAELIAALKRRCSTPGLVGLVHATAYTDDRQVMVFLQKRLAQSRIESVLLGPDDITWQAGQAVAHQKQLRSLFRFFPVEWLPNLSGCEWRNFFKSTVTLQANPGRAAIAQSKRFPLTWEKLSSQPVAWRRLLPESRPWSRSLGSEWVSKPNFGRVGDGIGLQGVTTSKEWGIIKKAQAANPSAWMAQRKFHAIPFATPSGTGYPCLGVYVIDGRAAGIYGRIAARPLIDHLASDVAVLVTPSANSINLVMKSV